MAEQKFIGGWTLSNFGGVGVIEMSDEWMKVQYYDSEPEVVEIQEEYEEDALEVEEWAEYPRYYVMVGHLRLYLDECMRY